MITALSVVSINKAFAYLIVFDKNCMSPYRHSGAHKKLPVWIRIILIQKLRWDFAVAQTLQVPTLKQSSCLSLTWHRCIHALCSLSNQLLTSVGNLYLMGLIVKAHISEFEYDVIVEFIHSFF